ncbi:PhzF family phenazine biosynthesis protein [Kineococcus rubinsiae]|uniref:PhzF family phenazine biosynthesis protein n=1 Tax=Kineococcus rubinsiae TaxID=2609562 RepID=UPI001430D9C5|nr:PhzF family phenazine biosynthesis protein [Kineococcus rubinsiae]NIZ92781.1 PhzF family phenazine biosynthesis protein [Kineococcus rubinsiae]
MVRLRIIDAFTDRPFAGNPAGVVVLDEPAPEAWMHDVAAELNLSETAFAVRGEAPGAYGLRWFTPLVEVDLCGHATLATAHALAEDGESGPFTFATRSGDLRADVDADGAVRLDFPAQPTTPVTGPLVDVLTAALGTPAVAVATDGVDVLVEVGHEEIVRALVPDIGALAAVEARGVVVTAATTPRPGLDDASLGAPDVVSRWFGPRVGVAEDPVTGSAHCTLGPYWAPRLGRTSFLAHQVSPRGGVLRVEVVGDRVHLHGRAVTVVDGELRAPRTP